MKKNQFTDDVEGRPPSRSHYFIDFGINQSSDFVPDYDESKDTSMNHIHGKEHGLWVGYYTNGKLKYKCNYSYGKLQGLYRWFNNSDGIITMDKYYI